MKKGTLSEDSLRTLIREVIVTFDGVNYEIDDPAEIEDIKRRLEFGSAEQKPENSRIFSKEKALPKLKQALGEDVVSQVERVISVYPEDTQFSVLKVLANNPDAFKGSLFSVTPEFGDGDFPNEAWRQLINVHRPGRSKAVGRGEIALSLLLQGVTPDSGSGAHDLEILGLGSVHVKEVSTSGGFTNPDVPMGKNITGADRDKPWAVSLIGTTKFDGKAVTQELVRDNAKAILDKFAEIMGISLSADASAEDYNALADAWQNNFTESFVESVSWGDAGALIFVDEKTGRYSILGKDDVAPYRVSDNSWRVGRKATIGNRWADFLKSGLGTGTKKKKNPQVKESTLRQMIREAIQNTISEEELSEEEGTLSQGHEDPSHLIKKLDHQGDGIDYDQMGNRKPVR